MMLVSFLLFAALPAVFAQYTPAIETATRCTSRFGFYPIPTGSAGAAAVPTWYQFLNITSVTRLTTEIHSTVTATYKGTTRMDMLTSTVIISATTTSTPAAVTVSASTGFIPLMAGSAALAPTPVPRIRRSEGQALQLLKRQTTPNNTGGFYVGRNGTTSSLDRKYVYRVDCRVYTTINVQQTVTVSGLTSTVYQAGPTAVVVATSTVSVTSTITEIAPRETSYAACQSNNVRSA